MPTATSPGADRQSCVRCYARWHTARAVPFIPLDPHFARVCARRGYKTAVIAVAHRLCRILFAMLRDGTDFSVTRVGVEQGDFERTTTYKDRLRPKPAGRLPGAS